MCNVMSLCEFECDEFDDKYLFSMAGKKEFADSKFPLDGCTIKKTLRQSQKYPEAK